MKSKTKSKQLNKVGVLYVLNYTKRYINVLAFVITILILVVLIIFDIINFKIYDRNENKNNQADENGIDIQSVYIELSKIAVESSSNIEEEEKIEEVKETNDREIIGNIDIYSTNVWRIKIPKLNLDAPITEGTSQEALRRTVGHFEQTDKWEGNVALAGHNRGYRCNFFQEIKTLEKGDSIIYCTEKGTREYKVILNKIIKETDWTYIQNTEDNRITLITCEAGKREYRRCIQAVQI